MPNSAPVPDETPAQQDFLGVAVDHATDRVPRADRGATAGQVRTALLGQQFEYADEIAVLEGARLVGLLAIERLFDAPEDAGIDGLMDADPPVVAPHVEQRRVAQRMIEHGETGIAVVDEHGGFVGLIPAHRMLEVLIDEHERDIARIAGYRAGSRRARGAAQESVRLRLKHRLPWLLIGLAGAMASAGLMAAFERELDEKVLLAFFVPAVVYLADAVGTQTEAVLIRGLSAGVSIRSVMRREIVSGLIIGVLLGIAFLGFALLIWGDSEVAIAVALALLASCSIATVVAMTLPWALQRLGVDPAFGSGPLATVVQDLLSIAVYLVIASAIAA
ncbi:MAG: magnesium transporter [Actinobacteria bacterium]|nr:magnesium transporter [Actinomycetota bacterium]